MNLDRVRKVYLIGICGTAMASLAGLLKEKGLDVCGSDTDVYPPMSTQLQNLGIELFSGYHAENLTRADPDLVIPGNAVPRGNPEVEALLNASLPYLSMAEALKEFCLREKHAIVIAGTHGKTTTASMTAWLLESLGRRPSFLVGGIPLNFNSSFQWRPDSMSFVIEGDEYDTGFMDRRPKFVSYLPRTVILNAVEYDHADIYPNFAAVEDAFRQLIKVVPATGVILVNRDSESAVRLARQGFSRVVTFGYHLESDYCITHADWLDEIAHFELNGDPFRIRAFGKHNVANAAAVAVLGELLGCEKEEVQRAFDSFAGVKRRMELRGEVNGVAVYDDFAHHPTAIATTLEGVRLAFPHSRIWGIFEPRSWSSRRNVFQNEFASAFKHADLALIAPVFHPEKLPPDVRLDGGRLAADIEKNGTPCKYVPSYDEIISDVISQARPGDKVILMSNGSFEGLHDRLLNALRR